MLLGLQKSLTFSYFFFIIKTKMSTRPTGGKTLNTSKII